MTRPARHNFDDGKMSTEQRRHLGRIRAQEGAAILWRGCFVTAVAFLLLAGYGLRQFRGLDQPQAMEQAQIGRNLARGEGFSTRLIRPLDLWQLKQPPRKQELLQQRHPDMMNPPAYPALVAALFTLAQKGDLLASGKAPAAKSWAARVAAILGWRGWWLVWLGGAGLFLAAMIWEWKRVWLRPGGVRWHVGGVVACLFVAGLLAAPRCSFQVAARETYTWFGPDVLLVLGLGVPLTLLNGWLSYSIARRLFDRRVGALAAGLFVLSDAVCQFAISGLSVSLAMAWIGAACLALLSAAQRADRGDQRGVLWRALAAAALVGGAFLTQYPAGLLLLPAVALAWWIAGRQRGLSLAVGMALVFAAVTAPWLVRNYSVSGSFLGLAPYQVVEQTPWFPGHKLERMLEREGVPLLVKPLLRKVAANAQAFWSDSPWLAGSGFVLLGFAGALLYRFRRPEVEWMKGFAVGAAALLFGAECLLGREPRPDSSTVQAGNLVALLLPLFAVFAAAMFTNWLDNLRIEASELRGAALAGVCLLAALPMLTRLALPAARPMAYPPCHPPALGEIAAHIGPQELMISDQPWAVAWYGDRRCVWAPYKLSELYKINDLHQHIAALLLTPVTLNNRFLTEILTDEWKPWAGVLGFLMFPPDFFLTAGKMFIGPELEPVTWEMSQPVNPHIIARGLNMLLICDRKHRMDDPAP
ncbi:MAG: glycosyltransferase family 39 protein [Verrucomicrobia bacterium]|nr:glycosyltransferase family 39 protein [Verrucomicrobiota bacterium]